MVLVRRNKRSKKDRIGGYLLPTVIALGLGISVAGVTALQIIAQNNRQLSDQSYEKLATEAAKAGVLAAQNCLMTRSLNSMTWPLTSVDCSMGSGANNVVSTDDSSDYTTGFSVMADDSQPFGGNIGTTLVSEGIVTLRGGTTIKRTVKAFIQLNVAGRVSRNVTQVSTGPATVCVIATDPDGRNGWPYCWGDDTNNQLGIGYNIGDPVRSAAFRTTPIAVARGYVPAKSAEIQQQFVCNGINTKILGLGCLSWWSYTKVDWYVPPSDAATSSMENTVATKVSVGTNHTCAIARSNQDDAKTAKAYCWGINDNGQLGTRNNTKSLVPVAVDVASPDPILMPGYCTYGTVPIVGGCWWGAWTPAYYVPVPISALHGKTVIDIVAGNSFTCARYVDTSSIASNVSASAAETLGGNVACWGLNGNGQLGNNSRTDSNIPVATLMSGSSSLSGGKLAKKLAKIKGGATMCVIATDGVASANDNTHCWGQNFAGQTGDSTTGSHSDYNLPIPLYCPLGDPKYPSIRTSNDRLIPSMVTVVNDPATGLVKFRDVAIYNNWTSAISTSDAAWYWGGITSRGCKFFLGIGSAWYRDYTVNAVTKSTNLSMLAASFTSLTSGSVHSGLFCTVKADNGLYCTSSRQTVAAPLVKLNDSSLLAGRTVVDLDTGVAGNYGCIVTRTTSSDGQVACWGANNLGQLGNRTTAPRATAYPVDIYGAVGDSSSSDLGVPAMTLSNRVMYF